MTGLTNSKPYAHTLRMIRDHSMTCQITYTAPRCWKVAGLLYARQLTCKMQPLKRYGPRLVVGAGEAPHIDKLHSFGQFQITFEIDLKNVLSLVFNSCAISAYLFGLIKRTSRASCPACRPTARMTAVLRKRNLSNLILRILMEMEQDGQTIQTISCARSEARNRIES